MQGLRLLIVILFGAVLLASCATTNETTTPPSSDDVQAATAFLAKSNEADGKKGGETWIRAIVLNTHYTKDAWSWSGENWTMGVLLPDGSTKTFNDDFGSNKNQLNTGVTPGDYVIIKGNDAYVMETDVMVLKKAAVTIKGK